MDVAERKEFQTIHNETRVTLGAVGAVLVVVIGAAWGLLNTISDAQAGQDAQIKSNEKALIELRAQYVATRESLEDLESDVREIKRDIRDNGERANEALIIMNELRTQMTQLNQRLTDAEKKN